MSKDLPAGFAGWFKVGERRWLFPMALGVLIAMAIILLGRSLWESEEAACARLYARAQNARDSAFVDQQTPTWNRGRAARQAALCGELRRMGRL
jgi:hypothetical protein